MAGIYLHIPFCRQACHYCDFHFSTNLSLKATLVDAIIRELHLQRNYLESQPIETIYFGGGTPSLLSQQELDGLLKTIDSQFAVIDQPEITLEANPDDLSETKLNELRAAGVNRLSIGIQSFHQPHLEYLNRAHTSTEAKNCVTLAQEVGFNNISIDLIYGIPSNNHDIWKNDLSMAVKLDVQHISAYCLTIEEKTVFGNWLRKGKIKNSTDEFTASQFEMMLEALEVAGYEQYEISNFSKPEWHSRHNTSYWQQKHYLGVGPGAHSFNGKTRQFNVSNNPAYIKALEKTVIPCEIDALSETDIVNERILTLLRTKWGLNITTLKKQWGYDLLETKSGYIEQLVKEGMIMLDDDQLILTKKGRLLADAISSALFI